MNKKSALPSKNAYRVVGLWMMLFVGLCGMSLLSASCNSDSSSANDEEFVGPVPVTVRLVTRFGGSATRAPLTDEEIEGRVDDVYIFFLRTDDDDDDGNDKVHSVVAGKDLENTNDEQKSFSASLEVAGSAGQAFRCIVLANAGDILATKNMNLYKEMTYDELQAALTSGDYSMAPLGAGDFVMWGEAEQLIVASRRPQSVDIDMLRAVARLDIGVGRNSSQWDGKDASDDAIPFKLKNIHIFKPNNRVAFMPVEGAYNSGSKLVEKPSPAGSVSATPFVYAVPAGSETSFKASIYLPEADVLQGEDGESGDENHTNRCAIIVEGSYDNHTPTFYRIDFHNGTELTDVLRNHRYSATITSVAGDGEGSAEDAYKSNRVNLTATVLDWNDWSQNVIFDGVDHVYVEKKSILLPGNKGFIGRLYLESNVDSEKWKMKIEGVGGNDDVLDSDFSVENTDFKVTLPPGGIGPLRIETLKPLADPTDDDKSPYTSQTATVTIKINRLEFKIQIEQRSDTPEDWVDGGEIDKEI